MKSTFSVIYYLKRQVVKKDGTVPVMGRITVDGSQTQFSCKPVSYTHLRAHETDQYLVCRLLLEKKKQKHGNQSIGNGLRQM